MKKLNFQIEVSRVLEILSNDIYDSPYALLRENIQNAYDAILMRTSANEEQEEPESFNPKIDVILDNKLVSISDNGIGMDDIVLENNFWKAGSSGKNNEIAKKAGVVGTFGIGAMANFGVASQLKVVSRKMGTDETIETSASREKLSVTEECVNFSILEQSRTEPGTTVEAVVDESTLIDITAAIQYLSPYIQHVQIPIYINGKLVSQQSYLDIFSHHSEPTLDSGELQIDQNQVKCTLNYSLNKQGHIKFHAYDFEFNQHPLKGDMVLTQGTGNIYGLRNYFGLAPLPVPNSFNFGGIVNLSNLHPTAGREALSRESINIVTQILNVIENEITVVMSKFDAIDNNQYFLSYIVSRGKYNLASKVKIEMKPDNEVIALENVGKIIGGKKVYFYGGRDPQTILAFGNENSNLLNISQSNPRRQIQTFMLKQKGIEEVPNHPRVISVVDRKELSLAEVALLIKVSSIISEDYLLTDNIIQFAKISHQVPSLIESDGNTIKISLDNNSAAIKQVLTSYTTAYEVFTGFIKDFIRNYLYQKFSAYIPSSTRHGAEALHKQLLKNRELFKYESTDLGELDSLLTDYVSGELEFADVLKQSATIHKTQSQVVVHTQVGQAEVEIPSLTEAATQQEIEPNRLIALPPIDRTDSPTDKKILKTAQRYPHLNNFNMFLSLSDRVYRRQLDFFMEPHTTKVIWGMHRIVYIFAHVSNNISLYYDIELKEKLLDDSTGGIAIPTTTILTKDRIFIPITNELETYFDIKEGTKEFFVRHDLITDFSKS